MACVNKCNQADLKSVAEIWLALSIPTMPTIIQNTFSKV